MVAIKATVNLAALSTEDLNHLIAAATSERASRELRKMIQKDFPDWGACQDYLLDVAANEKTYVEEYIDHARKLAEKAHPGHLATLSDLFTTLGKLVQVQDEMNSKGHPGDVFEELNDESILLGNRFNRLLSQLG
jgi:hypothetical protein